MQTAVVAERNRAGPCPHRRSRMELVRAWERVSRLGAYQYCQMCPCCGAPVRQEGERCKVCSSEGEEHDCVD